MQIADFFKDKELDKKLFDQPLICFKGATFPSLFFSLLLQNLNKSVKVNSINIEDSDLSAIKGQLSQSFLNINLFYWLGNISEYKKAKELMSFLNAYNDPHTLAFFINDDFEYKFEHDVIAVDYLCNFEQFNNLIFLWPPDKQKTGRYAVSINPKSLTMA